MAVRRATAEDVPRVAAELAHAFSIDPPMRWFLGGTPHAERLLRGYFERLVPRIHMRHDEAWMSDDPLGAALWLEPGRFEVARRIELPFGGPPLWRMWRRPRS